MEQSNKITLIAELHDSFHSCRYKVILVLVQDRDGNYLTLKLQESIAKWGIAKKIHIGVRDNVRNMKSAMKLAESTDVGYVSHTLQLHDALFTKTSVEVDIKIAFNQRLNQRSNSSSAS